MKDFFRDIFEYHHHFNRLLIDQVELYETVLPQRTYPMVCHILNASQVWNSRISSLTAPGVHQMHSFNECRRMDDTIFKDVLVILGNYDLDETIHYENSSGNEFTNSISDILFHASNHATHHKGQIISDFRLSGIEPLVTDYIFYKRGQHSDTKNPAQ
ncbi:MAG: DinB family protein [Ferruginibacter sp.]